MQHLTQHKSDRANAGVAARTREENLLREESRDMESLIDKLPAIYQGWFCLATMIGIVFIGAIIYDYLRRKSGARKFKR